MDFEKNKRMFKSLVEANIQRDGINDLMEMLEDSDFYKAPASTRFHGSEEGGLCAHSIAVGTQLAKLCEVYAPGLYSKETITIVSLFHDICKIGCYKVEMRNVKNEHGQWERVPFYKFEEDFNFGGHGSKSVFMIMQHMKLDPEEAAAINTHMGFSDANNITAISEAYNNNLLAWLLHVADEAATYVDKK